MASNILAKMAVQIVANNAKFNAAMKQSQAQMQGFQKTAQRVNAALSSFGVGLGVYELARVVQNAVGIMADFEHSMSEVRAITGATGEQFKALEEDALRLGRSTKFTATEVASLQVAYGRLGFTTREILDATEATLDLAAATGEDLAKAADVAGSTVRGFGLDAKETLRVTDVMASSFNKTALGLDNFTESMKYVAPIANAAGATVEETTAMLGVLADAGVRGSQAGTSLRKIFTDMTKDGRPLAERLAELAEKGITLADSYDEVGRTAQTSLLILSKNTEKTAQLSKELSNAAGEAHKMAEIMQDNLTGDVTKLSSAWEGLVLQFREGTGPLRDIVQGLTDLLGVISAPKSVTAIQQVFGVMSFTNLISIAKGLSKLNDEGERMDKWLEDMNKQALLDAFGDPNSIFASKDWNPFGSFWEEKNQPAKELKEVGDDLLAEWDRQHSIFKDKPHPWGDIISINDATSDFMSPVKDALKGVNEELKVNSNAWDVWAAGVSARQQIAAEALEAHVDKTYKLAEVATTVGSGIGEVFGDIAAGEQDLAQTLARVTEQIVTMFLRQSIAAMIAKAIKTGGPLPFVSIGLAAAGIGAVKALFSQIGGGGVGGGGSISGPGRTPSEYSVNISGRLRGYDLALVNDKQGYRRSRMG